MVISMQMSFSLFYFSGTKFENDFAFLRVGPMFFKISSSSFSKN